MKTIKQILDNLELFTPNIEERRVLNDAFDIMILLEKYKSHIKNVLNTTNYKNYIYSIKAEHYYSLIEYAKIRKYFKVN